MQNMYHDYVSECLQECIYWTFTCWKFSTTKTFHIIFFHYVSTAFACVSSTRMGDRPYDLSYFAIYKTFEYYKPMCITINKQTEPKITISTKVNFCIIYRWIAIVMLLKCEYMYIYAYKKLLQLYCLLKCDHEHN